MIKPYYHKHLIEPDQDEGGPNIYDAWDPDPVFMPNPLHDEPDK